MKKGEINKNNFYLASKVIFFLNVFVALMIIGSCCFAVKTPFGQAALWFGFTMLFLSSTLRILQRW